MSSNIQEQEIIFGTDPISDTECGECNIHDQMNEMDRIHRLVRFTDRRYSESLEIVAKIFCEKAQRSFYLFQTRIYNTPFWASEREFKFLESSLLSSVRVMIAIYDSSTLWLSRYDLLIEQTNFFLGFKEIRKKIKMKPNNFVFYFLYLCP